MNTRTILVMGVAGICGVSAAIGVNQLRVAPQGGPELEMAPVVLAAVDIPRSRKVTNADLRVGQWPKKMLPEKALTKVEDAVERAVVVPVVAGEPILDVKLAPKGVPCGLPSLIPKGMRAYTIQASKVSSNVAGFVQPENRVDVLLNLRGRQDDETGGGSTITLLQAVEILAVDQQLEAPADNKANTNELRSVTLLVTPDQAALLGLGQSAGQLTLSLRNPEDREEAETRPATLAGIGPNTFIPEKTPKESPSQLSRTQAPSTHKKEPEDFPVMTLRGSQWGEVLVRSEWR